MRLKTFTAETARQAMDLVRAELGDEAIIVDTRDGGPGHPVRVIAAVEEDRAEGLEDPAAGFETDPVWPAEDTADTLRQALTWHGVPPRLAARLQEAAPAGQTDPVAALAGGLEALFSFQPLAEGGRAPVLLVGPPGSGKTTVAAKLAARAVMDRRPVTVISTDGRRAGANAQLAALVGLLGLELRTAETADDLRALLRSRPEAAETVVDTAAVNPFSGAEAEDLARLLAAARDTGETLPVLVLAAGWDAMEAAEAATAFAHAGARRLLVTRMDMARRLGGVLAAADAARLPFCDVGISPGIADGLGAVNPLSLARLLLPGAPEGIHHRAPVRPAETVEVPS